MVAESEWWSGVPFPALLRAARQSYAWAIQAALVEAGCDDVPRNGSYVVGAIARTGAPLSEIIKQLGVSKQSAGHLIDVLVARGYLDRSVNPADRRQLTITLTERGRAAADVVKSAVDRLDRELVARVGAELVADTRATLASVIAGKHDPSGRNGDE